MQCSSAKDSLGKLAKLSCSVDRRRADGELRELTLELQSDGSYTASLRTASISMMTGEEFDKTEEIAKGLTLN